MIFGALTILGGVTTLGDTVAILIGDGLDTIPFMTHFGVVFMDLSPITIPIVFIPPMPIDRLFLEVTTDFLMALCKNNVIVV